MELKLNLTKMLEQETFAKRVSFYNPIFIFDSNAIKFRYEKTEARVLLTAGVVDEVVRKPEVFSAQSIYDFSKSFKPEVVNPFVCKRDEALILKAAMQNPKAAYRKNTGIGWVDTQQIAYSLYLARKGKCVVLVSNDADITGTIEKITEIRSKFDGKLATLSVRKYLGRIYESRFKEFNSEAQRFLISQIAKDYLAA